MRIRLLNDGGYGDVVAVSFPVEVDAVDWEGVGFDVKGSEIISIVGYAGCWDPNYAYFWPNEAVEVLP